MSIVNPEHHWPMRPWVAGRPHIRWSWHELKVDNPLGTMAHRRSDAVIAGVSTADDDDRLASRVDHWWRGWVVLGVSPPLPPSLADLPAVQQGLGIPREEFHGKVHSVVLAARHVLHVAGDGGANREQQGVKLVQDHLRCGAHVETTISRGLADAANVALRPSDEGNAFIAHDVDTALYHVHLVCLHVRHAIHHEPADAIRALVHSDAVAHLVELVCRCQTSGARADNPHCLSGAEGRRHGPHPTHLVRFVDDAQLH
mmetsp:Transcript_51253/g.111216  ORF Transcript_51253/g.111216 Transcript_51253/m.111216 type:complete len:257 (+) Transcript_51253:362-1132(+)